MQSVDRERRPTYHPQILETQELDKREGYRFGHGDTKSSVKASEFAITQPHVPRHCQQIS